MHEIIRAAGLVPWPKVFQALRSTRRTELQDFFPEYVLNSWFGHSSRVAERHYLQVRDEHFNKASGSMASPDIPAQHTAQQQATHGDGMKGNGQEQECENPGDSHNHRDSLGREVGVTELESVTSCMSNAKLANGKLSFFPVNSYYLRCWPTLQHVADSCSEYRKKRDSPIARGAQNGIFRLGLYSIFSEREQRPSCACRRTRSGCSSSESGRDHEQRQSGCQAFCRSLATAAAATARMPASNSRGRISPVRVPRIRGRFASWRGGLVAFYRQR
jgi:hypothetical protein